MRLFLISILGLLAACTPAAQSVDEGMPASLGEREQNLLRLAASTKATGNMDAAAELYRQAVAQSKGSVEAHLELASIYRQQKRPNEALQVLYEAQKLQPKDPRVLNELGFALVASSRQEEAVAAFDQALQAAPDNASSYNGKGVALDLLNRHAEAQAAYRKGLLFLPKSTTLKNNLALSLILDGKPSEATPILEEITRTADATPAMRQNLALAYGLSGNRAKAMEYGLKDLSPEEAKENLRFYDQLQLKAQSVMPSAQAVPVDTVEQRPLENPLSQ